MIENKPFWMVVREGESANAPTKKHFDEKEAYDEAARLLKKDPHRRFWVLAAIGGVYNTMQMTTVEFSTPTKEINLEDACSLRKVGPDKFGRYTAEEAAQNMRENLRNLLGQKDNPDAAGTCLREPMNGEADEGFSMKDLAFALTIIGELCEDEIPHIFGPQDAEMLIKQLEKRDNISFKRIYEIGKVPTDSRPCECAFCLANRALKEVYPATWKPKPYTVEDASKDLNIIGSKLSKAGLKFTFDVVDPKA